MCLLMPTCLSASGGQRSFLGEFDCSWRRLQISFRGSCCARKRQMFFRRSRYSGRRCFTIPSITCAKNDPQFDPSSVERPPYYSYMDSTSGQLEPASGARASIPGQEYWPEGTSSRVRAARAPEPVGKSEGKPSYGKNPGSRRRNFKGHAASVESLETSEEGNDPSFLGALDDDDAKDPLYEYVRYQTEEKEENLSEYELDKRSGRPHPFVDPSVKKFIEEPRSSEELWWNWRKPEKEQWSRWQRRRPDVDTVFAKAMAETGQIKLFGDHPTLTETALARARRQVFKEERLQAEQQRLEQIGPVAYYSEWVKAWTRDTSREAVKKHYEETGEDENIQLITMFQHQTAEEYRIMMGTDVRIKRDPLAMRLREDQIKERVQEEISDQNKGNKTSSKQRRRDESKLAGESPNKKKCSSSSEVILPYEQSLSPSSLSWSRFLSGRGVWGGDPVYPTVNYIKDPNEVIDYRGPDFHEPTPDMLSYLMEHGYVISRNELDKRLAKEKTEELEVLDMDDVMARAVDIGENDDVEDSEVDEDEVEEEVDEKISRNWSVLKSTPQLSKLKEKPKKDGSSISLEEAIDDSENLTDFLMDFDEEE